MKQRLPSKINIADVVYEVGESPFVRVGDSIDFRGSCDVNTLNIEILEDLSWGRKKRVFVHEMIHAMLHEAGIYEYDEELVRGLAPVLTQTLSNNDFSWMRK